MSKIWVYADIASDGTPGVAALEILTKARSLGADALEAVALGPGASKATTALGEHGATTVYANDDPVFGEYLTEPAAVVLQGLVKEHQPNLILFATSYGSRDIA